MNVLIANYRYFVSSGPERYLFNITEQLERAGHTVLPFSVRYTQNQPTPYSRFFVEPIGGRDSVYFEQHERTISSIVRGLSRTFYSYEVRNAIERMIEETRPDIAYVLYYLRKLSPSLLVGIKKKDLPLVVRISDYGMFCAEHHTLRNDQPCTLCQKGNLLHSVRYRCVKNSLSISLVDAVATGFHRWRGYFDLIDRFVTTNNFMTEMMIGAGFPAEKIICIPTFTNLEKFAPRSSEPDIHHSPYVLYVGRLDRPKGVHVLIEAASRLAARGAQRRTVMPRFLLAGTGHDKEYVEQLRRQATEAGIEDTIEFLGNQPAEKVAQLMQGALCCVMPALWYENLPNSVVESLASGCPVIASDIGSLSATISDGKDGLLFRPGDAAELALKLEQLLDDHDLRNDLAKNARTTAIERHAPTRHVETLSTLFRELTSSNMHQRARAT